LGVEVVSTAEALVFVEWLVVTARGVGWGSNVVLSRGNGNVGGASSAASGDLLEGGNLSGAASLGVLVVASASAAREGVVAVLLDNVSSGTAELGGWIEGVEGAIVTALEVSRAENLSFGGGNGDGNSVDGVVVAGAGLAARLLGGIIRGRATALEGVVVVADNAGAVGSTAAKLGGWVKGAASTALLVVGGSVGDDVVVHADGGVGAGVALDVGGEAAQVVAWVVGSVVSAALEVSVLVGQDVVGGAAELGGLVVSGGTAASEGAGDGLIVQGDVSVNSSAALLVVTQTLVSAALVGVGVGVLVDGVDAAEAGGGVIRL
jgi:hypothetical protein